MAAIKVFENLETQKNVVVAIKFSTVSIIVESRFFKPNFEPGGGGYFTMGKTGMCASFG